MLKHTIAKIVVAGFGLSLFLAPAATATPMPACGYFTGYDDCGSNNNTEPIIRFQPAPEEPWVWPEEGALGPYIWNPYTKRDNRHSTTKPPIRTKKPKAVSLSCPEKGSLNPSCW